ncbi:MAG: winged helix-turn-helix domain-containing protein [Gammaproteobacteria bacterium]|nr:winged helix-turn-helix domain-containing protein [Gammaproteobacteria bacterium]
MEQGLYIAVVSDSQSDAQRVINILRTLGYSAHTYLRISEILSLDHYFALVVCTRYSTASCVLPSDLRHRFSGRLLILSTNWSERAIVQSLQGGADRYLYLAESTNALTARLDAALRKCVPECAADLYRAPFHFSGAERKVRLHERILLLSPMEYRFARYLFERPNRLITDSELLVALWALPARQGGRRIDTAASRIRKKMCLDHRTGWALVKIRNRGFRLNKVAQRTRAGVQESTREAVTKDAVLS